MAAFEQGARSPDLQQFIKLANLYRCTLDEMMTSVKSATRGATPAFQARRNQPNRIAKVEGVGGDDHAELVAFSAYLQNRTRRHKPITFDRRPLEAVAAAVSRWTTDAKIDLSPPVPIFAILSKHGVEVRFTALQELAGALVLGDAEHADGILINSDQPYARQRFSAAHELGHLVLGHHPRSSSSVFVSHLGRRFEAVEVHADQFASELLTPFDALVSALAAQTKTYGDEPLPHQVYRLANTFMVSFQAMTTRLAKLGSLDPAEVKELEAVKPASLATKLRFVEPRKPVAFAATRMTEIVRSYLPKQWSSEASAETVRLLQETAYSDYVASVPEQNRKDSASDVYEVVALWVARTYPIVRA